MVVQVERAPAAQQLEVAEAKTVNDTRYLSVFR